MIKVSGVKILNIKELRKLLDNLVLSVKKHNVIQNYQKPIIFNPFKFSDTPLLNIFDNNIPYTFVTMNPYFNQFILCVKNNVKNLELNIKKITFRSKNKFICKNFREKGLTALKGNLYFKINKKPYKVFVNTWIYIPKTIQ